MTYLTREDIAARLQITTRTVDRAIKDGYLKAIKIGRLIRITEDSFNNYIKMAGKEGKNV